jgi:hypothetical protein
VKESGLQMVHFYREDLPAGTYFMQLKTTDFSETQKIIILE